MKKMLLRFIPASLLFCSGMAFLCINFTKQLPAIVGEKFGQKGDSTTTQVQILPDVAFFKSVFKNGSRILPKISFSHNPIL